MEGHTLVFVLALTLALVIATVLAHKYSFQSKGLHEQDALDGQQHKQLSGKQNDVTWTGRNLGSHIYAFS